MYDNNAMSRIVQIILFLCRPPAILLREHPPCVNSARQNEHKSTILSVSYDDVLADFFSIRTEPVMKWARHTYNMACIYSYYRLRPNDMVNCKRNKGNYWGRIEEN